MGGAEESQDNKPQWIKERYKGRIRENVRLKERKEMDGLKKEIGR